MVSLTFYGGANEIGGNKIVVESGKSRIFLDFGQSFSLLDDYFVDWLKPRERFGLRDYFALGLVPRLRGLYCRSCLATTDLEFCEPEYDAVFISHAHYDHAAHLQYLHEEIPIYMGETAKTILKATQETSKTFFFAEEDVYDKKGNLVAPKNDVRTFRTGKKISVGELEITPIHVDHSVPGAYGFLVEGKDARLVYTGDIRAHGNRADLTDDFVSKAASFEPDALVIEGTRVAGSEARKNHTERFVKEESGRIAKKAKGAVLAMRYPKDLDRFRTFYEVAKESGRKLVVSAKTAYLLRALRGDEGLPLPDPFSDGNIAVYSREMLRYESWEEEMRSRCIGVEWVAENQGEVIWELDFAQLTELIDAKPERGGVCIHSMSEPFEEDPLSQLQDDVLRNWLGRFGMEHCQLHASGHASRQDIEGMIKTIKPKRLIPIHTQKAEEFGKMHPRAIMPEKGKKIELR